MEHLRHRQDQLCQIDLDMVFIADSFACAWGLRNKNEDEMEEFSYFGVLA